EREAHLGHFLGDPAARVGRHPGARREIASAKALRRMGDLLERSSQPLRYAYRCGAEDEKGDPERGENAPPVGRHRLARGELDGADHRAASRHGDVAVTVVAESDRTAAAGDPPYVSGKRLGVATQPQLDTGELYDAMEIRVAGARVVPVACEPVLH